MQFNQILARGFAAANRVPLGLLLYFLLLGLQQGLNLAVGGMISPEKLQTKPGEAPPPEVFALMGYGCFTCIWGLITVFATPWVTGGVVGQLRDRMLQPANPPSRFTDDARRFYLPMLALSLIWAAAFIVIILLLIVVGAAIVGTTIGPGQQIQQEQWQQLNLHPANIASAVVFLLLLTLMGIVWSIAQAIVVVDGKSPVAALGAAARFYRRHMADALKLFLIFALLNGLLWTPGPLLAALDVESLAVRLAIGLVVSIYFSYLVMFGLGSGVSLYMARQPQTVTDGATSPPPAGGLEASAH